MTVKISIVIPSFNEANYITKCLEGFLNQNIPFEDYEVLVCDGKSTDGTQQEVEKFEKIEGFNCRLLINEMQKTPFALNLGLKAGKGKYLSIFGAHAVPEKDFLKNSIMFLDSHKEFYAVGGVLENVYENNMSKVIGKAMSSSFGVGNAYFRTGNFEGEVDTVAFGAYKKEVFEKVGYFDEDLTRNQDDEFNYRLVKNNLKMYLTSKIKAKYFVRASIKKLKNQYYQYGYWKVFVNKKHKAVTTFRQLIPPLFVLFLIGTPLLGFIFNPFWIAYFLGLIVYFLGAFIFALKKSNKTFEVFQIMFIFFILHYFYGLGYLSGIIDFYLLNKKPKKSTEKVSR